MTKKSDAPAIRFKGFSDAWEQRKLTEFVEFFSGLTYTPNDVQENGTLVLRSSNVSNGEVVDADNIYVNPQVVNSENVKVGDIVVVVRNGSRSLIGKHAQIKAFMPNTVIGAFMTGIRSECPEFTNALLNTSRFEEEIAMNMGATINQITGYMFSKMEFKVPRLDEQKKIGEYFEKLDNLITLHQRKFEKLTNVKKSMLEKMFPQNGSSYPEIRFKGFTDPWEQRKLGEVIRLNGRIGFRGYTEKDIVSKDDGGVLTFSPTNIVDNKLTTNCKNTYITRFKYDESPEIKIHNGDILFVKTGSTLGKSALVTGLSEDATLNPQVVVMRTNNLNAEFLAAMLVTNAIISQVNSAKIGGAVPTLTETRIKDFDVAIPVSEAEKEQIGQFFSQLDHLITLHQRELEKLQNIKKSMLEKMFV